MIAKYLHNGSLAWIVKVDGTGGEFINDLAVNAFNEVVVALRYTTAATIVYDINNNVVATYSLVSGHSGLLLSFYSNGTWNWGARITMPTYYSTAFESWNSVAVGQHGDVVVSARYLAPKLAFYDASGQIVANISNFGGNDILVAKLSRRGALLWLTQLGGPDQGTISVADIDPFGDVLVMSEATVPITVRDQAGYNTVIAGTTPYVYLVKLGSTNGSFLWSSKIISGPNQEKVSALSTDHAGDIITCGYFTSSTATVEDVWTTNRQTLTNTGTAAGFVIKLNRKGQYVWAIGLDSPYEDRCQGVTVDSANNVIVLGQTTSCSLIPNIQNAGWSSTPQCQGVATFITKLDTDGQFLWTAFIDGQSDETPQSICADQFNDDIYAGGISDSGSISLFDGQSRLFGTLDLEAPSTDGWFVKLLSNGSIYASMTRTTTSFGGNALSIPGGAANTLSGPLTESSPVSYDLNSGDNNRNVSSATSNLLLFAISGACAVLLICTGLLCFMRRRTRLSLVPFSSTTYDVKERSSVTITSEQSSSLLTAILSNHELSIPAFLQMNFGIDFRQEAFIAKGGGGALYSCSWLSPDLAEKCQRQPLILKIVSEVGINTLSPRMRIGFFQEIAIMYRLRDHPSFCKVYAFSLNPASIVMRYYELGDMEKYIHGQGPASLLFRYTKLRIVQLIHLLCKAVAFIHENNLVHCDIKPLNVLLDTRIIAEKTVLAPILADFGITRVISEESLQVRAFEVSEIVGASISFAAPEVWNRLRKRGQDVESREKEVAIWKAGDVFAIAMTMLEVLQRKHVW